jgi:hypothetical protein
MNRSRALLVATALVLALSGCGGDPTPAAAPTPTASAAPTTPAADGDQDACHAVSTGPDFPTWQDANLLAEMANTAAHAPNPGIAAAGDALAEKVAEAQAGGMDQVDANLALMRAHLELAEACGHRFGDGPW